MPPGVRGTAVSESDDYEGDDSDEEEEEEEEEALIRRNRRRGRSAQRRSARQARRRSPSDPLVSHICVTYVGLCLQVPVNKVCRLSALDSWSLDLPASEPF